MHQVAATTFIALLAFSLVGCGARRATGGEHADWRLRWDATWAPIHAGFYPRLVKLRGGALLATFDRKHGGQSEIGVVRSGDGGATWSDPVRVAAHPSADDVANAFPLELADGTCVVAFRHHSPGEKVYRLVLSASEDGGATWQPRATIARGTTGLWEPMLVELPDATLQAYYASEEGTFPDQRIEMRASRDGGRTWGPAVTVARRAASRDGMPGVVRFRDGTLFVVFEASDVQGSLFVIRAVRSRDDGRTWSPTRQLIYQPRNEAPARWAAGAPSVVEVRPGHLLVSFQTDEDVTYRAGDLRADPAQRGYDYLRHCRMKYVASIDGGRTWGGAIAVTDAGQAPALWGALYVPQAGDVCAVSGFAGRIWLRRGAVRD